MARNRKKRAATVVVPDGRSGTVGSERLAGGRVARLVYEGDPDQRPVVHGRVEDVLDRMLRKDEISRDMFAAGRTFEQHFRRAHLTGYALSRVDGMGVSGGDRAGLADGQMHARTIVWTALRRCGHGGEVGLSQTASVAWHVVGLGETLNQWATRQQCNGRAVRADVAKGILIAALDVLAAHFGFNQK